MMKRDEVCAQCIGQPRALCLGKRLLTLDRFPIQKLLDGKEVPVTGYNPSPSQPFQYRLSATVRCPQAARRPRLTVNHEPVDELLDPMSIDFIWRVPSTSVHQKLKEGHDAIAPIVEHRHPRNGLAP